MQYWVAYNHCVICLCARGGWSEIPLYNNITPRSQTLSTLFGNEKLWDSSVNVKPLLLGRWRHRIESVMFGAQFLHLDVVIIMFVCGFVWSDFAHLSLAILTVKTSLMWLVKFRSMCVCHCFWDFCVLDRLRIHLFQPCIIYVSGGFTHWIGTVKNILLNL